MAPHMIPGLSPEAATNVCMNQCGGMCCRGPLILTLLPDEVLAFLEHAARMGVRLELHREPDGGGSLRFLDHPGDHCPMLDDATSACRIYEDRPKRCREFPDKAIPWCAISGS